jgi:hypothetical protein
MKYFILKRKEDLFEDQATIIEVIDAGNFSDMYADGIKINSYKKPTKLFYTPYKGKIPDYVSGTNSFPIVSENLKRQLNNQTLISSFLKFNCYQWEKMK